jgi:hypothetical protein
LSWLLELEDQSAITVLSVNFSWVGREPVWYAGVDRKVNFKSRVRL